MTARKPAKPKPRKGCKPTLEQRVATIEAARQYDEVLREVLSRLDALEARAHFRDASHDEPVSNAGEAIGQHFRIVGELPRVSRWRRFWNFMGSAS